MNPSNPEKERQKKPSEVRTDEDVEESNELLARMYDFGHEGVTEDEANAGAHRTGFDERSVFDALDDKAAIGGDAVQAREEIAAVYEAMTDGTSVESQRVFAQEEVVRARAESTLGTDVDSTTVATRVGAEIINNTADDSVDHDQITTLNGDDIIKASRATAAAELMKTVDEQGIESLDQDFSIATTGQVRKYTQTIHENGGVERTSNQTLAEIGRYIEQNPEIIEAVEDSDTAEIDTLTTAESFVDGTYDHSGQAVSRETQDKITNYLKSLDGRYDLNDSETRKYIVSEIERTIVADRDNGEEKR